MLADRLVQDQAFFISPRGQSMFVLSNIALDPHSESALLYMKFKGKEILIAQLSRSIVVNQPLNLPLIFQGDEEIELVAKQGSIHIIGSFRKSFGDKNCFPSTSEDDSQQEKPVPKSPKPENLEKLVSQAQEEPITIRRSSRVRAPPPKPKEKESRREKDVLNNMAKLFQLDEGDLDDDEEDKSLEEKADNEDDDDDDSDDSEDQDFEDMAAKSKKDRKMEKQLSKEFNEAKQSKFRGVQENPQETELNDANGRKRKRINSEQDDENGRLVPAEQTFSKPTKNPYN